MRNHIIELEQNVNSIMNIPESDILPLWKEYSKEIKHLIETDDPNRFLRWSPIKKTMVTSEKYIPYHEVPYIKKHYQNSRWRKALKGSRVGTPSYLHGQYNNYHHLYHIARFQKEMDVDIRDYDFIFEFGGGYGNMCRAIHDLEFNGKYVIYDLPVQSALQTFYLNQCGLNASFNECINGIDCIYEKNKLEKYSGKNALIIATWSLSESPEDLRDFILNLLDWKSYLITYHHQYTTINNSDYFQRFKNVTPMDRWFHSCIEHLGWKRHLLHKSYYLFGVKR